MKSIPDLLLPEILQPQVQGTIFAGHIHHFDCIGSTNTAALEAAQDGAPEGTAYFAEEQSSGHGRGGHDWYSAPSTGIYLSVVLRPSMGPADVLVLSLMAGVATAAAVEASTGLRPDLRWPNDLLLPHANALQSNQTGDRTGQRKFCGILTELKAETTRVHHAVIGIGINVNQEQFPPELETLATSLRIEGGREWPRANVAAALLRALDSEYRRLQQSGGREDLFRRFETASSYGRGRKVHVDEAGGYTGLTDGLDSRGFLRVRASDGSLKTVISGGVRAI